MNSRFGNAPGRRRASMALHLVVLLWSTVESHWPSLIEIQ
jgi:hypothetical protein